MTAGPCPAQGPGGAGAGAGADGHGAAGPGPGQRVEGGPGWAPGGHPQSTVSAPVRVSAFSLTGAPARLPDAETVGGIRVQDGPGQGLCDVAAAAPQCFLVTGASCGLQKRCEHVEGKRFCPTPPDSGCRPGWHGRAFAEARVRAAVRSQRCLFGSQREGKGGAQCAPA